MDFKEMNQVQAIIGSLTPYQASMVFEFDQLSEDIPIVSITPTATPPQPPSSLIQMSADSTTHMQCIAAIVGHFRWRKVTAIYERSDKFATDSGLVTQFSDSLHLFNSFVEHHLAFPHMSSLSNPEDLVETELKNLKRKNNRVFVLIQSSLKFAALLLEKAKLMGMMEKDSVWIVSDEIASLLDSMTQSVTSNMQGVIGFRTSFVDNSDSFRKFKLGFRKKYSSKYPEEEEHSNPSIYALRTYDAVSATARAIKDSQGNVIHSKSVLEHLLASNFKGLSGEISFKGSKLAQLPTFQIINVIGKSYNEIALWSPKFGNGLVGEVGAVIWPGGGQTVPKGWSLGATKKALRIAVPARGAFNHFVKVSYDQDRNETYISGFSVDVFEAAVKLLPYHLPYVLVPHYGSYDEMVAEVYNKSLDAAVGDTEIMAERYEYAEFSQPYMESGLVMVVTLKPDTTKDRFMFMKAFKMDMWVLMAMMSFFTGFVVWLTEMVENNPEFRGSSVSHHVGSMIWFSVTLLSFAQRESIRSNLSRLVLAAWLFVTFIVAACFTAVLTSMLTVQRLEPSILTVEYLQRTNAIVGCNGNSFILRYLVNALHFLPENIKQINSITDYPNAFKNGDIAAAFFVEPHAKVFLAEYCKGYTTAGPTFKLGGFGFVFQKGSPLAEDISEAILKVTEKGTINQLERHMLSFSNCSSSTGVTDGPSLGLAPFSGLFLILGRISALVFLITIARILERQPGILSFVQGTLINCRIAKWALFLLSRGYTKFGSRFSRGNSIQGPNSRINMAGDTSLGI
ncbi:hypothetical protein RJ639_037735, partial [Escallonia herrerae]